MAARAPGPRPAAGSGNGAAPPVSRLSRLQGSVMREGSIRNPQAPHEGAPWFELSDLDRDIIRILQRDGRRPFAQMARDLGVTEKTVRRHVDGLRSNEIIEITTIADHEVLGYGSSALVGVRVAPSAQPSRVAATLAELDEVDYVVVATGRFQVIAEVLCRDTMELITTLEQRVTTVDGVIDCESFPYLRLYYQQPAWSDARDKTRDGARGDDRPVIDDLDRRIIVELNDDGRVSLGHVAKRLGVSESLVRQRTTRLLDSGTVRVMAITNPASLGFQLIAWLGIVAAPGVSLGELADHIADRGAIAYLAICGGRFDIFAEAICADHRELLDLLDREIRPIPGVARVEVSICVDLHYKRLQPRF
ncbi:MAG: hypothetical protein QOF04_2552 [Solirubrobacteraceae bacterium]|jgi:DNA-binding Lrp family transcriptional regulator|nr:hypothetical protein [Solirubrobacteraceae bacterium]